MDNKKAEAARTKQHAWTTKKQRQGRGERDSKLKREIPRELMQHVQSSTHGQQKNRGRGGEKETASLRERPRELMQHVQSSTHGQQKNRGRGREQRDSKLKRDTQRIDTARTKQHACTPKKQRQGRGAKRQQA
jgi:hypothetical protein